MFGWKRFVKRQRRALFKMVSDKDHHDLNTLGLFVDYEDKERRLILQNCVLRETSLGAGNRGNLTCRYEIVHYRLRKYMYINRPIS